jgi:hypothetical protein
MFQWRTMLLPLLTLTTLLAVAMPTAAQSDRPCGQDAPDDGFTSQGVGLTLPELEALYGEPEVGQGSLLWEFPEVDLHWVGCDLILAFPLDKTAADAGQEFSLAQGMLPDDAEFLGSFARGSTIREEQASELWRSDALAERFALLGENRGGEILILYTYELSGFEPGAIERVELRTLEIG